MELELTPNLAVYKIFAQIQTSLWLKKTQEIQLKVLCSVRKYCTSRLSQKEVQRMFTLFLNFPSELNYEIFTDIKQLKTVLSIQFKIVSSDP